MDMRRSFHVAGCIGIALVLLVACGKKKAPEVIPAATKGNAPKVERLLGKGADPNERDSRGYTALMVAAEKGYNSTVQALLEGRGKCARQGPRPGPHRVVSRGHHGSH